MTDALTIVPPGRALRGRVSPPGSKSITNRALLLAALACGTSRMTGALKSDDTRYMADALRAMSVTVEEPDATLLRCRQHRPPTCTFDTAVPRKCWHCHTLPDCRRRPPGRSSGADGGCAHAEAPDCRVGVCTAKPGNCGGGADRMPARQRARPRRLRRRYRDSRCRIVQSVCLDAT